MDSNCPRCGLDLPKITARFCPECGFDLKSKYIPLEDEPQPAPREPIPVTVPELHPILQQNKPEYRTVIQHTFASDEWEVDDEGKRRAEILDDDDEGLKKWLRAKRKRIVDSTDPKIQYLIRNRSREVKLIRFGEPLSAAVYDVFIKRGYDKIYVDLYTDGGEDRSFSLDSIEIADINKDGEESKINGSCVVRGCLMVIVALALIIWLFAH